MSIRVDTSILNQNGTPAFNANAFAFRPAAGYIGRIFISIDSKQIFRDTGSAWDLISDAGSGSSNLQQVTANGNYTPYGINITSGGLFLLGSTNGGIFFADGGSGQFTQDATTLFWDDTNKRLGINTASPSAKLDVHSGSGTNAIFNGTGVTNAVATFQSAGTSKWSLGNYVSSAVANDFCIYDNVNTAYRFYIHNTGVINIPTSLIIGSTTPTSSYTFDLTGSAKISSNLTLGLITQGSVLFAGASGLVSQNNSNFFWDNTNNRLGLGVNNPNATLELIGLNGNIRLFGTSGVTENGIYSNLYYSGGWQRDNTSYYGGAIRFASSGGILFSQDNATGAFPAERMRIATSGNVLIGTTTDNGYKLNVNGALFIPVTNRIAYGSGYIRSTDSISVSTSATTIFTATDVGSVQSGVLLIVNGVLSGTGANFTDIVLYMKGSATANVISSSILGTPAARVYSVVSADLRLTMASGTYAVGCVGFNQGYNSTI